MKKVILKIKGMSCSACSNGLEKHLKKQDGIIDANVNLVMEEALITFEDYITIDKLNEYVKTAGFTSMGEFNKERELRKKRNESLLMFFMIIYSLIYLYYSMGHMISLPLPNFFDITINVKNHFFTLMIMTIPYLLIAKDIFKNGFKNIRYLMPNMDSLVTIGVFTSFLYSLFNLIMIFLGHLEYSNSIYFESTAFIILFVKIGRILDSRSKEKTKVALEELVQITPEMALLKEKGKEIEVTIDEVKIGDTLIVKPGMKVAVDGKISKGTSYFDETFLSGESKPVKKSKGDTIYAGTINLNGTVEYVAEKIGINSSVSKIVELVREATNSKATISKVADRVCQYFVPCVILISVVALITNLFVSKNISSSINLFVTILVVACPCSLGLASPLAIVISMGICAKRGILIKSSAILEYVNAIDTVVFDKTGTLTYGSLKVAKVINYSKLNDEKVLSLVASLEKNSTHPISNAFKNINSNQKCHDFEELSGLGVKGLIGKDIVYVGSEKLLGKLKITNIFVEDIKTLEQENCSILYVIKNNEVIALLGLKDVIRDEAKETIKQLKEMNKNVMMLSGDNEVVAHHVAEELGITNYASSVSPKEKNEAVDSLIRNGHKVMMIGDGINDAPSLALAHVGVSVSSASDIATSSADVILIHDNLWDLINLFKISKRTIINIKENLFWAFFYNSIMILIALGLFKGMNISINPMLASLAMALSSLSVILNALRLNYIKMEGK